MNKKTQYHLSLTDKKTAFLNGLRDGIPIGLGYLAVSFSLGITAKNAGLTAFQGFIVSFFCNASAGEYVGFTLIAAGATYLEMAIATLIANARYLLMSCAMSQRMQNETPLYHRLLMACDITDELFGIAVARPGYLNPYYTYGAVVIASPLWAAGTALGIIAGNVLPLRLVSALGVALYGMFIAIIIPPAKTNKIIAGIIIICFILSYTAGHIPLISEFSDGTRTIILTVVISAAAAVLFPYNADESKEVTQ